MANGRLPDHHEATSVGWMLMGMHRSGTSALARVLALCGADIGARVLGASAGNEAGHWEDAVAVEIHERLLARLGLAWDAAFALPEDWAAGAAAAEAREAIRAYVANERSRHPLWVVKDPRICLFGSLWQSVSARPEGLVGLVMLRHPAEVAGSLQVRDGVTRGRAFALWLEHAIGAARCAVAGEHRVVTYEALLSDWRAVIERLRHLPGAERLDPDAAQPAISAFLDAGRRHHRVTRSDELPVLVREVWDGMLQAAEAGRFDAMQVADWVARVAPARELAQGVLADWQHRERQLWQRVGSAEALVTERVAALAAVPADVAELRVRIDEHRSALMDAISGDIQTMQHMVAAAERERGSAQAQCAGLERQLIDRDHQHQAVKAELTTELVRLRAERDTLASRTFELEFENRRLRDVEAWFDRVTRSRSWRWTRPLRVLARLLGGRWSAADTQQFADAARSAISSATGKDSHDAVAAAAAATRLAPLPPADSLPDVFVWAVIDWHFRFQRPQHIAKALAAKGHRVFYLSNHFVDAAEPGFHLEPLDDGGRLFQIRLHLDGAPSIYFGMPTASQIEQLRASLATVLVWAGTRSSLSLVQHPYWSPLVRSVPNARVIYDCMDHHGGFENNAPAILEAEDRLCRDADLLVVTSDWLHAEVSPKARATALVRNAAEFRLFSERPSRVFQDERGRRVIGYYGAIAEWFDVELVRQVAHAHRDCLVLLVGRDTVGAAEALGDEPNIRFIGEVPYHDLTYWLYGLDVCLLPFKVMPLTLATNPVKVYEYLAAGRPVVAVELPEMSQFAGLVATAVDAPGFLAALDRVLREGDGGQAAVDARRSFAARQTWDHRAAELENAVASMAEPRVSVIVLTYNNLPFTQACLSSIETHSDYRSLEVIVVDNASSDGSREWLQAWASSPSAAGHVRKLILNDRNLGFSAGNNVGLRAASGEYLVVLNNDTYVTPGWVRTLINHLRSDPGLGLVGPVTNNIGNEARIEITYADMSAMIDEAQAYTLRHPGKRLPIRTAAFFCVAMRRETFHRVGDMDEAFGVGFFEDDDYCRRVEQAGLSVACAEDVFVHHHLSASFDALKAGQKQALFERNKAIYEAKWGQWRPHEYRKS